MVRKIENAKKHSAVTHVIFQSFLQKLFLLDLLDFFFVVLFLAILFFNALVYLLTFKDQFSMLYSISVIVFFMNYPTKHCYIRNFEHDDFDDHYESDLKKE